MRRAGFGSLATAAVLAALAGAGGGAAPNGQQAVVQNASKQISGGAQSPASAPGSVVMPVSMLPSKLYKMLRDQPRPIWSGIEKRGNRRNRSRFNYNR
jgi:hypothetical protein